MLAPVLPPWGPLRWRWLARRQWHSLAPGILPDIGAEDFHDLDMIPRAVLADPFQRIDRPKAHFEVGFACRKHLPLPNFSLRFSWLYGRWLTLPLNFGALGGIPKAFSIDGVIWLKARRYFQNFNRSADTVGFLDGPQPLNRLVDPVGDLALFRDLDLLLSDQSAPDNKRDTYNRCQNQPGVADRFALCRVVFKLSFAHYGL